MKILRANVDLFLLGSAGTTWHIIDWAMGHGRCWLEASFEMVYRPRGAFQRLWRIWFGRKEIPGVRLMNLIPGESVV